MKERGDLQDKQDKSTARTANNGKNQFLAPVVCRASIYALSEAKWPLGRVATLTGFEEATAINCTS